LSLFSKFLPLTHTGKAVLSLYRCCSTPFPTFYRRVLRAFSSSHLVFPPLNFLHYWRLPRSRYAEPNPSDPLCKQCFFMNHGKSRFLRTANELSDPSFFPQYVPNDASFPSSTPAGPLQPSPSATFAKLLRFFSFCQEKRSARCSLSGASSRKRVFLPPSLKQCTFGQNGPGYPFFGPRDGRNGILCMFARKL